MPRLMPPPPRTRVTLECDGDPTLVFDSADPVTADGEHIVNIRVGVRASGSGVDPSRFVTRTIEIETYIPPSEPGGSDE